MAEFGQGEIGDPYGPIWPHVITMKVKVTIGMVTQPKEALQLIDIDLGDLEVLRSIWHLTDLCFWADPTPNLYLKCPFFLQSLVMMLQVTSCAAMTG